MDILLLVTTFVWVIFGVYWLISAIMTRSPVKRQESLWRWVLFLIVLVWVLLAFYFPQSASGFLIHRVIPDNVVVGLTGAIITLLSLSFAVWARVHLGKNWSSMPAIKVDHKLIRTGPYSIVRHPIYTGILFGVAGTAIIIGKPLGLVVFFLVLATYLWKIRMEEKYLQEEFGEDYARYKKEIPALIPLLV
jgi:protein-S-isoprenylcysteine O-methyltransferase Ste14